MIQMILHVDLCRDLNAGDLWLVVQAESFRFQRRKSTTKSLVFQTQTDSDIRQGFFQVFILDLRRSTYGWQLPQIVAGFVAGKSENRKETKATFPAKLASYYGSV